MADETNTSQDRNRRSSGSSTGSVDPQNILVIGGTGAIGKALVAVAAHKGHNVYCMGREGSQNFTDTIILDDGTGNILLEAGTTSSGKEVHYTNVTSIERLTDTSVCLCPVKDYTLTEEFIRDILIPFWENNPETPVSFIQNGIPFWHAPEEVRNKDTRYTLLKPYIDRGLVDEVIAAKVRNYPQDRKSHPERMSVLTPHPEIPALVIGNLGAGEGRRYQLSANADLIRHIYEESGLAVEIPITSARNLEEFWKNRWQKLMVNMINEICAIANVNVGGLLSDPILSEILTNSISEICFIANAHLNDILSTASHRVEKEHFSPEAEINRVIDRLERIPLFSPSAKQDLDAGRPETEKDALLGRAISFANQLGQHSGTLLLTYDFAARAEEVCTEEDKHKLVEERIKLRNTFKADYQNRAAGKPQPEAHSTAVQIIPPPAVSMTYHPTPNTSSNPLEIQIAALIQAHRDEMAAALRAREMEVTVRASAASLTLGPGLTPLSLANKPPVTAAIPIPGSTARGDSSGDEFSDGSAELSGSSESEPHEGSPRHDTIVSVALEDRERYMTELASEISSITIKTYDKDPKEKAGTIKIRFHLKTKNVESAENIKRLIYSICATPSESDLRVRFSRDYSTISFAFLPPAKDNVRPMQELVKELDKRIKLLETSETTQATSIQSIRDLPTASTADQPASPPRPDTPSPRDGDSGDGVRETATLSQAGESLSHTKNLLATATAGPEAAAAATASGRN